MPSLSRPRAIGLGATVVLLLLLTAAFTTNWLKQPVEWLVSEKSGREFRIDGNFRLRPGWPTKVYAENVRFANPDWAIEKQMLTLDRADVRIKLLRLLTGELILPEVHVTHPVVALEMGRDGRKNWVLGSENDKESGGGTIPQIGLLQVDRGKLKFHDPVNKTSLEIDVATTLHNQRHGIALKAAGSYKGMSIGANGTGGPILSIKDRDTPYPLSGSFNVGDTRGHVSGTITGLVDLAAVDMRVKVDGNSLDDLFPLIGVTMPPTPPYHIEGRLRHDGTYWRFHDFAGRVGDSDLSGDVDIYYVMDERTRVTAKLKSNQVDIDDLGGFIGAPPQTGAGETSSAEDRREVAKLDASSKLLPDKPYKLHRLRAMDADITFTGLSIKGRRLPLDNLFVHATLKDGVLKADPLNFGVAGGTVASKLDVNARKDVMTVNSDVQFKKIDLAQMFPESKLIADSSGLIGGRAQIKASGNTFADLVGNSDGTLGVAMRGGKMSNLLLEFAGLDVAESLKFLMTGDKQVKIRCAVADLKVTDGVLQTKSAVVDTTDTNIHMEGKINMKNEGLDLTVRPAPKDWSPVSLRSPIHIKGNFKDPEIKLDEKAIMKGGFAGVLAALAAPIAALIPLIETGKGKNADCEQLIAAVEQHNKTTVPQAEFAAQETEPRPKDKRKKKDQEKRD